MASILGLPSCGGSTSTFNSGTPLCDVIRQQPKSLFLIDGGVSFTPAQAATIATLVAAFKTASRSPRGSRVYPIHDLTNFEDKTKEPARGVVGNLSLAEVILNNGIPAFNFQHHKGDLFHQQLANAQNQNLKLLILDSSYVLYGTRMPNGNLTGYSLIEMYAELAKFATASSPSSYPFSVVLASLTEIKENFMPTQLDASILSVTGNIDVALGNQGQTANALNVSLTGRGGKNIGDIYPVELSNISAFVITNTTTGAAVTTTSVSYNATIGCYVVSADPVAYAALASGATFNVALASPSVLSGLGVDGFEGTNIVKITKP